MGLLDGILGSGRRNQTITQRPLDELMPYLFGQAGTPGSEGQWVSAPGRTGGGGHFSWQEGRRTTPVSNLRWQPGTPEQAAIPGIVPEAADLYGSGGLAPGFTGEQTQGQQAALDYASQLQGIVPGMQGQYQGYLAGALDPFNNPALASSISGYGDLLGRNLRENILPAISDQAAGTGNYFAPSGQSIAEGIAARGAQEQFGRQAANMVSDAYSQGQRNFLSGLGMAPGVLGLGLMPSDIMQHVGGMRQEQADREGFGSLSRYADLVNSVRSGTGVQQQPIYNNQLSGLLGLGMMGAGLYTGNPMLMMGGAQGMMGPPPGTPGYNTMGY